MARLADPGLTPEDSSRDLTHSVGPPRQVCGFSDQTGICHWQGCDGTKRCDGTTRQNDSQQARDLDSEQVESILSRAEQRSRSIA